MKLIVATLALALAMPLVSGFQITNCVTGQHTRKLKNGKCHDIRVDDIVAYEAGDGARLTIYQSRNCNGESFTTDVQNLCQEIHFTGMSVKAD